MFNTKRNYSAKIPWKYPKYISIGISEILLAHSTVELYPVIKSHEVDVYVMTYTDSHTTLSEKQVS